MKRKALLIVGLNLAAMLADGLLTWIATPDLSLEGNPLVRHLGLGWGALIVANTAVFALIAACIWYAHAVYRPPVIGAVADAREYVSMLMYGRPDRFRWIFYRLRCNWRAMLAAFGYSAGYAFLLARLVLVFEWIQHLLDTGDWYWRSVGGVFFGRPDILMALVACAVLLVRWFRRQYRLHLQDSGKVEIRSKQEGEVQ